MKENLYALIKKLGLEPDTYQLDLIKALEVYRKDLEDSRRFSRIISSGLKLFRTKRAGVYIWGGVGRGKSIIANTFYNNTSVGAKRHFHFHQFMIEIHKRMLDVSVNQKNLKSRYIMRQAVKGLLPHCNLLFLDELQINNIADLSVLSSLFTTLKYFNIFTVITSNRSPSDLFLDPFYKDRKELLVNNIERIFDVFHLGGHIDYRSLRGAGLRKTFFYPLNKSTEKEINDIMQKITDPVKLATGFIKSYDRDVKIPLCLGNTAVFTFSELCEVNFSASDYIAISHQFKNIVIRNIPKMDNEHRDQALRFITLIDCLYEGKTRLICSAEVDIENLYSGNQHKFEFARTESRLKEMSQMDYSLQIKDHILGVD